MATMSQSPVSFSARIAAACGGLIVIACSASGLVGFPLTHGEKALGLAVGVLLAVPLLVAQHRAAGRPE